MKKIKLTLGASIFTIGAVVATGAIIYNGIYSADTTSALTYSNTTDLSFTFNPTLSISLSSNTINIDNLVPGQAADSDPITVSVSSNTPYGYSLYADVGNSTNYDTTSLTHADSSTGNNAVFTSIATNANIADLTNFQDNTWGYSYKSTAEGSTWSTYNGLPLYSTVDNNTSTENPAKLIDTKDPADNNKSISFKLAAKASSTQASGTYNNVINFYAVGKPLTHYIYDEIAAMSKGIQTAEDLKLTITEPTSTNYHEDVSNSGVYEYNSNVFGKPSDASDEYKVYYYRGVLDSSSSYCSSSGVPYDPETCYGFGGDGKVYPNYVILSRTGTKTTNDTCWRIIRTTGSGGIKMIFNSYWNGTCVPTASYGSATVSSNVAFQSNQSIVAGGYTYNNRYISGSSFNGVDLDIVLGNNSDPTLNNKRSAIKTYLEDNWYASRMTPFTSILEPSAGYCNDRTVYNEDYSQQLTKTYYNQRIYFGAKYRRHNNLPSLSCPRGDVDIYRYIPGSSGISNELKYPVALLTADELAFTAGDVNNAHVFTYDKSSWWTLSPETRPGSQYSYPYIILGGMSLSFNSSQKKGVRPVVSLKLGTEYISGSGTATDPWVVPAQ